jgi:hypothetical protein
MKKDVLVDNILELLPIFSITAISKFQGGVYLKLNIMSTKAGNHLKP